MDGYPTETNVITLEPGSNNLKIAFLDNTILPYAIPSVVVNVKSLLEDSILDDYKSFITNGYLVAQDALDFLSANKNQSKIANIDVIYPIRESEIVDYEALDALLVNTLKINLPSYTKKAIESSTATSSPVTILGESIDDPLSQPKLTTEENGDSMQIEEAVVEHPLLTGIKNAVQYNRLFVLLSTPVSWTKLDLCQVTKILFEANSISGLYLIDQPLSTAYGFNFNDIALVFNVGHEATSISPIYNDSTQRIPSRTINLGGLHIEHALASFLIQDNSFLSQLEKQLPEIYKIAKQLKSDLKNKTVIPINDKVKPSDLISFFNVIRALKENGATCDIGRGLIILPAGGAVPITKTKKKPGSKPISDSQETVSSADPATETISVTITIDGQNLTFEILSSIFKRSVDVLFKPSDFGYDIPSIIEVWQLVLEQIDDVEKRLNLCDNIILTGGSSNILNFRVKLQEEAAAFISASETSNEYQPRELKFNSFPEYFPTYKGRQTDGPSLGASIVARLVYIQGAMAYVTLSEFNKIGVKSLYSFAA